MGTVNSLALDSQGRIVAVGNFTSYQGNAVGKVVRLNNDGSYDATFTSGVGFNGNATDVLIDPYDNAIVAGTFGTFNGDGVNSIVTLNTSGKLAKSYSTSYANGYDIKLRWMNGKILLAGRGVFGGSNKCVAVLNLDGSLDYHFKVADGPNDTAYSAGVDSSGNILLGGQFRSYNNVMVFNGLMKISPTGSALP